MLVSGGSSLPVVLEDFFEMIRATVIVGYGMTETSPVITNRYTRGLIYVYVCMYVYDQPRHHQQVGIHEG